jgi:uncharacterized RDD family membrane protein YckC
VDLSRAEGVYYQRQDYAGLWRRLLAAIVDAIVAVAGLFALLIGTPSTASVFLLLMVWLALFFLYLIVCKRTRVRTLGYRLARVRLVDIRGDSPRSLRVTFRLLLALMGGYSSVLGLVDLLWITGDDHKQALRDKLAHTYVIRAGAQPAGRGPIVYDVYHVLAWTLYLPEVRRAK